MQLGIPMYVACWCMYDIKNPARRHPDRIEFKRRLMLSSRPYLKNSKKCIENLEEDLNTSTSTLIMQQNVRTVNSLDDIMDLNAVENGLKEVKHPNGQICYIEDSKSINSQTSIGKTNEDIENNDVSLKPDTSEEEKSVIALLDNVLKTEDDDPKNSYLLQLYDRKTSVDSEMVPSVIRSTTVVTVHSSSNSDRSGDCIKSSVSSMDSGIGDIEEKQKVAKELVDEILNSQELWLALEKHQQKVLETDVSIKMSQIDNDLFITKSKNEKPVALKRVQSIESILSTNSVDDPLHSEKFRNKLSMLIIKPPEQKSLKDTSKTKSSVQEIHRKLKHSKSETDVRKLVLNALEGCNPDIEDKNDGHANTKENRQYIPKPPKFDPVLYKTINNIRKARDRPSLEKLLRDDESNTNLKTLAEKIEPQSDELPFKQKLEAILRRGPSRKTQNRPDIEQKRPKSEGLLQLAKENLTCAQFEIENNPNTSSMLKRVSQSNLCPVKETPIEF